MKVSIYKPLRAWDPWAITLSKPLDHKEKHYITYRIIDRLPIWLDDVAARQSLSGCVREPVFEEKDSEVVR